MGDAQRGFAIVVLDVRVGTGPEIIESSTKLVQDMICKAEICSIKIDGKIGDVT